MVPLCCLIIWKLNVPTKSPLRHQEKYLGNFRPKLQKGVLLFPICRYSWGPWALIMRQIQSEGQENYCKDKCVIHSRPTFLILQQILAQMAILSETCQWGNSKTQNSRYLQYSLYFCWLGISLWIKISWHSSFIETNLEDSISPSNSFTWSYLPFLFYRIQLLSCMILQFMGRRDILLHTAYLLKRWTIFFFHWPSFIYSLTSFPSIIHGCHLY